MREQARIFAPKFIFVKATPDGVFFDMQDELCIARFEFYNVSFDD